jgi:hypothetical protein
VRMYAVSSESHQLHIPVMPPELFPLRLLLQHRLGRHSRKPTHYLDILLLAHLLIALTDLSKYFEVIDIERGSVRVEELRFLVEWIGERMRCANRYSDVVANMRIVIRSVGCVEAYHALCYEEGLIVHLVPMSWRTGRVWWECEFGRTYAVVWNDQFL